MLQMYAPEALATSESWLELIAYYSKLKKMLPDTYIREAGHLDVELAEQSNTT